MADAVKGKVEGDGYAVGHLDGIGEGFGFRKVRQELGVTAFGVNAIVMPPDYAAGRHKHERQEELYFVHRGTMAIEFGDGSEHVLETGGLAWVAPDTARRIRNAGDGPAPYVIAGGTDGHAGRAGRRPEDEDSRLAPRAPPGASAPGKCTTPPRGSSTSSPAPAATLR